MPDIQAALDAVPTACSTSRSTRRQAQGMWARRGGVAILLVIVALGAFGVMGPRAREVSTSNASGQLTAEYPSITRPGLDTEITLTIAPEQDPDAVRVAINLSMLSTLGVEYIYPEPESQTSNGSDVVLEFAGPETGELVITISGRVPTKEPPGIHDWQVVWLADEAPQAVDAQTWILP